ncbi:MAG TPA: L-lactate dehydrogenase, partial [Aggregatilineales bacterium]|nr:L-lactate dehydrogenase [Aggregatilineales bacterium]
TRVMGSGTTLDTARFRALLGDYLGIDSQHVHAYVVGEHGDSEVLTWSLVTVGGVGLDEFSRLRHVAMEDARRQDIDNRVRHAAAEIIDAKGATYYGIGSALARIVEAILRDQRSILTVCTRVAEVEGVTDVTLSLPHLVGGDGVLASFPLPLSAEEHRKLHDSADIICSAIDSLKTEGVV